MKPYYYVRNVATGLTEEFKSEDISDALFYSENQAMQYPGTAFEILRCVGFSQVSAAKTFWMDGFFMKSEEVEK